MLIPVIKRLIPGEDDHGVTGCIWILGGRLDYNDRTSNTVRQNDQ